MTYRTFHFLTRAEAERILPLVQALPFQDGRATAFGHAREVKQNLQCQRSGPEQNEADLLVTQSLSRHEEFQSFALPKRLLLFMYNRYEPGMHYGPHVDNSLMGGQSTGDRMRTDLSATIFLSSPDTYDGGELVLDLPTGPLEIKLDAGEGIVYASGELHHVNPVTRGVRLAAVTWIQSIVRDERLRAMIFDLSRAANTTPVREDAALSNLLSKTYHNLIRYAAEP